MVKTRVPFALAMLACACLIASGCGNPRLRTLSVGGPAAEKEPVAIEIDNLRGDVEIVVNPHRKPKITGRFKVEGKSTKSQRRAMYREASIDASYDLSGGAPVLRIAAAPSGEPEGVRLFTKLKVRVPACDGVVIRTTDGEVKVFGAEGPVDISAQATPGQETPIAYRGRNARVEPALVTTNSGSILFEFGPGTAAAFDLETIDGEASLSADSGELRVGTLRPGVWTGVLNGGGPMVRLQTGKGSVRAVERTPAKPW